MKGRHPFALNQEGLGFDSGSGRFCEECVCSSCVNVGSLGSLSPKTCKLGLSRLIGLSKLPSSLNVSVDDCVSALR